MGSGALSPRCPWDHSPSCTIIPCPGAWAHKSCHSDLKPTPPAPALGPSAFYPEVLRPQAPPRPPETAFGSTCFSEQSASSSARTSGVKLIPCEIAIETNPSQIAEEINRCSSGPPGKPPPQVSPACSLSSRGRRREGRRRAARSEGCFVHQRCSSGRDRLLQTAPEQRAPRIWCLHESGEGRLVPCSAPHQAAGCVHRARSSPARVTTPSQHGQQETLPPVSPADPDPSHRPRQLQGPCVLPGSCCSSCQGPRPRTPLPELPTGRPDCGHPGPWDPSSTWARGKEASGVALSLIRQTPGSPDPLEGEACGTMCVWGAWRGGCWKAATATWEEGRIQERTGQVGSSLSSGTWPGRVRPSSGRRG